MPNETLLTEILPQYDICSSYSIRIKASPEEIFRLLEKGIPSGTITKFLMGLRSIPRMFRKETCPPTQNAFYRFKEIQNREMVLGITGQFWNPVMKPVTINSLEEFLEFHKEEY